MTKEERNIMMNKVQKYDCLNNDKYIFESFLNRINKECYIENIKINTNEERVHIPSDRGIRTKIRIGITKTIQDEIELIEKEMEEL